MYEWLPEVCKEIRSNMIEIYWISIVPLTLLLIILEFFKLPEREPNALGIIKRAALSIILLMSFDEVFRMISLIGDGIVTHISPTPHINEVLSEMWKFVKDMELSWHQFKETLIWILSLLSFIFAYLGAFIADALVHFCWGILFVMSPLMILAYISEATSQITKGLYRSLCIVMVWKITWTALGVILLKLTAHAPIAQGDDYNAILLIVINLFIGTSMLVVPITTKAFLSSDFATFAGGLAAIPAIASQKIITGHIKKAATLSSQKGKQVASHGVKITARNLKNFGNFAQSRGFKKLSEWTQSQPKNYPRSRSQSHFQSHSQSHSQGHFRDHSEGHSKSYFQSRYGSQSMKRQKEDFNKPGGESPQGGDKK